MHGYYSRKRHPVVSAPFKQVTVHSWASASFAEEFSLDSMGPWLSIHGDFLRHAWVLAMRSASTSLTSPQPCSPVVVVPHSFLLSSRLKRCQASIMSHTCLVVGLGWVSIDRVVYHMAPRMLLFAPDCLRVPHKHSKGTCLFTHHDPRFGRLDGVEPSPPSPRRRNSPIPGSGSSSRRDSSPVSVPVRLGMERDA